MAGYSDPVMAAHGAGCACLWCDARYAVRLDAGVWSVIDTKTGATVERGIATQDQAVAVALSLVRAQLGEV